jgi:hypothetical protein
MAQETGTGELIQGQKQVQGKAFDRLDTVGSEAFQLERLESRTNVDRM